MDLVYPADHRDDDHEAHLELDDSEDLAVLRAHIQNLRCALQTRHVIGVAQGLLMASYRISEAQAFAYLRRLSNESNVKLREVAGQVVADFAQAVDSADQPMPD